MVKMTVNGVERTHEGDPSMPLLWFLRDEAQLTGTKYGCGMSLCGACTVHMDGQAVRSCTMPVAAVAGAVVLAASIAASALAAVTVLKTDPAEVIRSS